MPLNRHSPLASPGRVVAPHRLVLLLLMFLLGLAGSGDVAAQHERTVAGRIVRITHGYIAIGLQGSLAQLTRYDDSLRHQGSIWLRGAIVRDVCGIPRNGGGDTTWVMLADISGGSALFRIPLKSTRFDESFDPAPLSRDTLPAADRLIGPTWIRNGASEAVVVAGDSVLMVVDMSGTMRMALDGRLSGRMIVAAYVPATLPGRLLAVALGSDGIHLMLIDATTGSLIVDTPLGATGHPRTDIVRTARGELMLIAIGNPRPIVWVCDVALASHPWQASLAAPPLGITTLDRDGSTLPAVVLSTLPRPSLQLVGRQERLWLDYPLGSQPEVFLDDDGLRILAGPDSLVMYDSLFRQRGVAPSPPGPGRSVIRISDTEGIVAGDLRSHIVTMAEPAGWLERHWGTIAIWIGGVLIAVVVIAAWRRYRFLRTIYTNMVRGTGAQGIVVTSRRGRVQHLNDSARRSLGIDSYIPLGRHLLEYLPIERFDALNQRIRRLLSTSEPFVERVDVEGESDIRALALHGRPMTSERGSITGYLLLIDDVTGALERERLLNWASVAHHIAHEMKTPLGTMTLTAELLHDRLGREGLSAEFTRSTARILRQTGRLRGIIDDLMTIARTESIERAPADLGLVLEGLIQETEEHLPPTVSIRMERTCEDARCSVDVHQITAAMRNVITNAWQAIGERTDGRIDIALEEQDDNLIVSVKDNGIGMTQRTLERLFQPFYTERAGGSGIGTIIVKRVIEGHGGTVAVESRPGEGSRFVLTFPRR